MVDKDFNCALKRKKLNLVKVSLPLLSCPWLSVHGIVYRDAFSLLMDSFAVQLLLNICDYRFAATEQ